MPKKQSLRQQRQKPRSSLSRNASSPDIARRANRSWRLIPNYLGRAWTRIAAAASRARVAVVLGTERVDKHRLIATALVLDSNGATLGFQDKVQVDPSEDSLFVPGTDRHVFETAGVKFGIAICHEGWRYPETVRWAARRGAQIVFHPHFSEAEPGSYRPSTYGDLSNTFHEKAVLCRAAENNCYFATINFAGDGSPTTSAIASPDGTLLAWQPYGQHGLLVAEIDLSTATGLLASRCKY